MHPGYPVVNAESAQPHYLYRLPGLLWLQCLDSRPVNDEERSFVRRIMSESIAQAAQVEPTPPPPQPAQTAVEAKNLNCYNMTFDITAGLDSSADAALPSPSNQPPSAMPRPADVLMRWNRVEAQLSSKVAAATADRASMQYGIGRDALLPGSSAWENLLIGRNSLALSSRIRRGTR